MSDNPLADWLRDGGPWSEDDGPDAAGPATALGPAPPSGPEAVAGAATVRPVGSSQHHGGAGAVGAAGAPALPPDWDDDPEPPRGRSRRLLLVGLATVPWLGFAAVALGALGGADTAPDGASAGVAGAPASGGAAALGRDEPSGSFPDGTTTPTDARPAPAPLVDDGAGRADAERRAGTVASVAVRAALTGEVAGAHGTVRYADLAMVEAVDWIGDIAIVEVAAVVLESAGEAWGEARPAWFAVPVRVTEAGATPVADPWPVASAAEVETPAWEPVDDAELATAAAQALAEGGYEQVTEVTLSRSDDVAGVLAAEVVAVAPGAGDAAAHRVWLRDADPPLLLTTDR